MKSFLDWPVAPDAEGVDADVALLGIPRSEPYPRDPQPNDQARAPDAIRAQSARFCYAVGHWDFDTGTDLASVLPPRHFDLGNALWSGGSYDDFAASVTERHFGLGSRTMPTGHQFLLDLLVILDDPVMHQYHMTDAMRVRVLGSGLAMRRPACMPDTAARVFVELRAAVQELLDVLELAL